MAAVAPIRMISSMATRDLLAALVQAWHRSGGAPVDASAAGGVDVARRVREGEVFDVVALARDAIDALCAQGLLRADSRTDLARSGIAVAVPAHAPAPDISNEAAVRQAVLDAPSLGYSTGPSGTYLTGLFSRWGILEQVRPRIVQPPPGVAVGRWIAEGRVALGFQQASELLDLPGVRVVGPLPDEVQSITVFSAAITAAARDPESAAGLLRHLAAPQAAGIKRRFGMEPA